MTKKYKLSRKKRTKIKGGANNPEHEAEYQRDVDAHEAGERTNQEHFNDFVDHESHQGGEGGQ